jgi:hypothetical protein
MMFDFRKKTRGTNEELATGVESMIISNIENPGLQELRFFAIYLQG